MAAWQESPEPLVVDLRKVSAADLAPLLDEETGVWQRALDWDFEPSAELVRRFVDMQALSGFALLEGGRVSGYCYYIREEKKGLIGDLYVRERDRTAEREHKLIEATLEALWRSGGVHRVESQLLLLDSPLARKVPFAQWFRAFPRRFLEASAGQAVALPDHATPGVSIAPWTEARQDDSARLVAAAYRGHVDSDINDQYRSPSGARRFLNNIVQYPGCGTFFGPASYAATDAKGALCGMSLASLVSDTTGHITQICVSPAQRGKGVGYALLRRSMLALAAHGCRTVGLTVTSTNTGAIRLYEQMGFTDRREFAAYIWDAW
ncbi:MAG TPA: GNAT family N-acetyltransferase [Bryobacteraceae bacterium]|nr:GNAT family N-acetyltransferase [Bryobacteraceae bacterium]